jgi:glycosyltransferase involved in cell wall biosynthesis
LQRKNLGVPETIFSIQIQYQQEYWHHWLLIRHQNSQIQQNMPENIRILYINPFLPRADSWTGVRGNQLVQELRNAGAEVNTFPPVLTNNSQQKITSSEIQRFKRFVKTQIPIQLALILIDYYQLIQGILRTVISSWQIWRGRDVFRPDIVVARTMEYDWTPWIAARILKRPLVLEIHSLFYIERQLLGGRKSRLLRWFERVQLKRAECVWVVSSELEAIIRENGVSSDRIFCVPFGLKLDGFADKKPRLNEEIFQIIFVGSFYLWHGLEPLLKAFSVAQARMPSLRLCLVGDGIARSISEKEARTLGIEHSVHFTGWLPRESMIELLNKSDIAVAPYLKLEPFYFAPVKILDYMAAGLAIVASKQGQICEMLEHHKEGLLVSPGDVSELADALLQLAENPSLRQRLGEAARTKIAHTYTWERTVQGVLSVCQEAVRSY